MLHFICLLQLTKDHNNVFICDMGISNLKEIAMTTLMTTANSPRGTFPYMAPELFCRERRGPPVDIYAFGCLVVEVFGAVRVWKGLNAAEIMQKICGTFKCAPISPPVNHLPALIGNVCSACFRMEPNERPLITEVIKI